MQTDLKKHFKQRIDIHSSVKKHPFSLVNDVLVEDGIRMWSLADIAASKVYATSIRATKKDFWDIDRLLDCIDIQEIADSFYKRYNQFVALGVPKMLTYFGEADVTKPPDYLFYKTWSRVKKVSQKKLINN